MTSWRTETFRLFKGGSLWLPPQPQQFTSGMPDEVFEKVKKETESESNNKPEVQAPVSSQTSNNNNHANKRGRLSHRYERRNSFSMGLFSQYYCSRQKDHLEDLLRQLTPERTKIGDAMLWAIDHAEAADEIIDCIADSLAVLQTPAHKKVIFMI